MHTNIEYFDQQRMLFLKWYLIGFAISFVLLLTRHFFRLSGLNEQAIGIAVLAGAVAGLVLQIVSLFEAIRLEKQIQRNEQVKAALYNELVKSILTQSWQIAYIATSAMTLFFAITSSFYPICDPLSISLTSILAGAGACRAYFYFRYKRL